MLSTSLTDLLGCTVPVLNAPMGGTAGSALAAAVTAGGGTGLVGVTRGDGPDAVARQLAEAGPGTGAGVLAWALAGDAAPFDAILAARPALVSVAYGDWAAWARRLRAEGIPTATPASTLDEARRAVEAGVDVLVVRGAEAGGHGRNEVATLPLLQEVLEHVEHPCVVAAGGIGSGRGLAAVLAAGAAGAWVGTALLASDQAVAPGTAREAVLAGASDQTVHSRVHDVAGGVWPTEWGGRALRDPATDRWAGREDEIDASVAAEINAGPPVVWAGQGVGLVREARPAEAIVADMGARAEELLRRW